MGIMNWLRSNDDARTDRQEPEQVTEAIDRVMALNPRLGMVQRCRERLGPAVAASLRYATGLVASLPAPHEASARTWASDLYMRAFFARPEDLTGRISRSEELRVYFEQNPDSEHAYAVLGMAMTERRVLGVALEGNAVRRDVAQTTVCFSDHRVRICGRSESELRREIVRRVIDQLALTGLAKLAKDRRDALDKGRALLKTRLLLLQREGTGMRSVCGGGASVAREELVQLQAQIDDNSRRLGDLRVPTDALERQLDGVCQVLMEPGKHVHLTKKKIRLDRMNVVQTKDSVQAADELEFHIAHIPTRPPQVRAISLVRFARAELLPGGLLLDQAMREL
ncbi:hypothetical protein [Paraburkholderia domus]|uniref:hypothetical protein n=1 Tax=Paraburkholderia domus TaxID=2793075 RepID=UPI00191359FA|nr:hypothetical protein [Paraburkholderia domus]MBK5064380.1 hypothetical protein [Burkholderia sp. R-70199]MBK5183473.1 hypothetical protein [Burkholderia sp. R-69749]CAE6762625.1 hypothetical protein R75483_03631 [Paraburkholderia domus]CAE6860800.1 hypothetical protein R69749_05433 [Paraburkholderia domus]CAE6937758.1 hypothetical protein R70199_05867 [Paraburkholderia domus]